jgi:hypothetical protein
VTLSLRQQRFVGEYVASGGNGLKAAAAVGYKNPGVAACRLLKNDNVRAAIEGARARAAEAAAISHEWLLARLRENVERAMQAVPVIDREGNPTGNHVYQGAVANKALELIGRHTGFFERKVSPIKLPSIATAQGCGEAADLILSSVAAGDLSLEHAAALGALVENRRRAIETVELDRRLAALEGQAVRRG